MVNNLAGIVRTGLLGLLLIIISQTLHARPEVGSVKKIEPAASAVYQTESRKLEQQSSVFFEDSLLTGPGARLSVVLTDGSDITLGENASLVIDEFVYEPEQNVGNMALKALHGAFLFVGGKVEYMPEAEVSIATPMATLGIRGTTVWGGLIDDGYGVLTLEGEVTVTNVAGSVTLRAGEGTMLRSADQAPEAVKTWPQQKVDRAMATIQFAPAAAQN